MADSEPKTPSDPLADVLSELRAIRAGIEAGPAEVLDADAVAAFLGCGRSKVYELDRDGFLPAAIDIGTGRLHRWLRSELLAWLGAGAPSRVRWQSIRNAALRQAG